MIPGLVPEERVSKEQGQAPPHTHSWFHYPRESRTCAWVCRALPSALKHWLAVSHILKLQRNKKWHRAVQLKLQLVTLLVSYSKMQGNPQNILCLEGKEHSHLSVFFLKSQASAFPRVPLPRKGQCAAPCDRNNYKTPSAQYQACSVG